MSIRKEEYVKYLIVAVLAAAIVGCGGGEAGNAEPRAYYADQATEALPECDVPRGTSFDNLSNKNVWKDEDKTGDGTVAFGYSDGEGEFNSEGAGGGEQEVERKPSRMIIYTALFVLNVYDREEASKKVVELAREAGGYVSTQTNEAVEIRIPADSFVKVTEALPEIGRVLQKDIRARDVTEQFTDLKLRIAAKRKYLESLQKLLEKAQEAKAMLEIQREVGKVVEEIESLEGRLRYLADHIAFSTISVRFNLATQEVHRAFRLPFQWVEELGMEHLLDSSGGVR
jgi:hypothetical protein